MTINNDSYEYIKSNQTFLKNYNIKKVLSILLKYESLSRIELSEISNLDKKTITNIIKELLELKQVKVISRNSYGIGRPKEILKLNGDYCYCIGVDLGGSYISGVVLDFSGKILSTETIDLHNDLEPETLIKICYYVVDNLLKKSGMKITNIIGIGIALPGFMDREAGLSLLSGNFPKWFNIPLKKLFQEKYNTEIYIDDCSRLLALAELWYGAGSKSDNFLTFDLALGIGCGIVINRKVFSGSSGKSGELGHTIVKIDGPLCNCGRHGCIESLASGWALTKQAQLALDRGEKTLLRGVMTNQSTAPTVKDIILAAKVGDDFCRNLLISAGQFIGIGIANSISLLNPSQVIINGKLIEDNDLLIATIEDTIKLKTIPEIYNDSQISISKLGVYAIAMGASTLCLEKFY